MKAITPVIAIVILILMAIAAAAMAYLMITSFQQQATGAGQTGLETLSTRTRTQLKIESVSNGKIYLRNYGTVPLYGANFFLDGRPLEVSGSDECPAGHLCTYIITGETECDDECRLSMGADMPLGTRITVPREELGGGANYTLTLEASKTWASNTGYARSIVGFDGSRKMLTFGDYPSQLQIWNVTAGTIHLENDTTLPDNIQPAATVKDLDADGKNEIIALILNETQCNLTIYNYTQPNLYLENLTQWSGWDYNSKTSVQAGNIDGDAGIELVVMGEQSPLKVVIETKILNYSDEKTTEEGTVILGYPDGVGFSASVGSSFLGDVDGDTDVEIVLVYTMYENPCFGDPCGDGTLNITTWDGTTLTSEHEEFVNDAWFYDVTAADVDSDSVTEILTMGSAWNATSGLWEAQLSIWSWDGGTLTLEKNHTWSHDVYGTGVRAADLNDDGTVDIVTTGMFGGDRGTYAGVYVFTWNGTTLTQTAGVEDMFDYTGITLDLYDIDGDGTDEILIFGIDVHNEGHVFVYEYGLA